ncbi:hypothetical protein DFJ74DRAFT_704113 [Hyaloraphidium curvatum]|nr:hypothetical protein DFJ74DRAFT_704113 [Hyaloraphidium curvatum]
MPAPDAPIADASERLPTFVFDALALAVLLAFLAAVGVPQPSRRDDLFSAAHLAFEEGALAPLDAVGGPGDLLLAVALFVVSRVAVVLLQPGKCAFELAIVDGRSGYPVGWARRLARELVKGNWYLYYVGMVVDYFFTKRTVMATIPLESALADELKDKLASRGVVVNRPHRGYFENGFVPKDTTLARALDIRKTSTDIVIRRVGARSDLVDVTVVTPSSVTASCSTDSCKETSLLRRGVQKKATALA